MNKTTIFDEIKSVFSQKNNIVKQLIAINVGVFVVVNLIGVFLMLFNVVSSNVLLDYVQLPASLNRLLYRFWTPLTYQFLHVGFFHILFNMLWLFWLGNILQEYLGSKRVLAIYLYGGFAGAFFYILAYNVFPLFDPFVATSSAMGASAGVLAVIVGTATLLPDYSIRMLIIGEVRLKYLALAIVLLDLLSAAGSNAGGHFAHLGGALFGFVFVKQLQSGNDWSVGINNFLEAMRNAFTANPSTKPKKTTQNLKRNTPSPTPKANQTGAPSQTEVDKILDKISAKGYESLSKEEKEILFKASKTD